MVYFNGKIENESRHFPFYNVGGVWQKYGFVTRIVIIKRHRLRVLMTLCYFLKKIILYELI